MMNKFIFINMLSSASAHYFAAVIFMKKAKALWSLYTYTFVRRAWLTDWLTDWWINRWFFAKGTNKRLRQMKMEIMSIFIVITIVFCGYYVFGGITTKIWILWRQESSAFSHHQQHHHHHHHHQPTRERVEGCEEMNQLLTDP